MCEVNSSGGIGLFTEALVPLGTGASVVAEVFFLFLEALAA